MFGFLAGLAFGTDAPAGIVRPATIPTAATTTTSDCVDRRMRTGGLSRVAVNEESASHHEAVKCSMSARA